ncbi:hypothetical protein TRM7557_01762 [Tritonibacter multivorans]|uniref:Toxin VasX N-terminal region domain-containing protein n=1 Tax=Tritonibacter multivorans TaxID=928856 RepID=A0A0P1G9R8_9RHOB|nr:toxin VasX [Tritonibacter multivorans]MDA7423003.1 hypothetical protein [Tritonibacter multivorans]CUH78187.1 hypothetical protein TRM7557_01762 [Tritonibacter multivorans]SFD76522.1 hypothetical protein SAMN04488049_1282 [Tritonibacter multivorans]
MPEAMTENAVDSPFKFCDPDVIALFPVRYALTGTKLSQIAEGSRSIAIPTSKDSLTDHELRRIRAGYVYVYGDNDTWRVYRYLANPHSDENSTLDFDDAERDSSAVYRFYEIEWSNGADSTWRKKSAPSPFVTLSATVTTAWIAYSEERWPPHMLELLEVNIGLREKVMTKIDLSQEETPHSFKLDQLSEKVADFNEGTPQDPAENQMRYTQLQPEHTGFIATLCDRNLETARAVVLRDDLGEISDLGVLHLQIAHAVQQFSREHYYATSMADCVDLIKDNVDENLSWWKSWTGNHPLNPEFSTLREQVAADIAAQRARPEAIVNLMADVFARSGNFSAKTEIEVATNGIKAINTLRHAEVWEYAWFLIGRSWQFAAVTPVGTAIMGAVSMGQAPGKLNDWYKSMDLLLKASIEGTYVHSFKTLRHFNFALSSQAHAFATEWVTRPSGLQMMQKVLKPFGIPVVHRNVPIEEVTQTIRAQFAQSGLVNAHAAIDAATGNISSARTPLLNVPMIEGTIQTDVSAGGQAHFQRLHDAENVLKGAGLLAGLVTTYSALGQLSKMTEPSTRIKSVTPAGAAANNEIVQVISELVGLLDGAKGVAAMRGSANLSGIRAKAMESLFQTGSRLNTSNIRVLSAITRGNAIAPNLSRLVTLANAALAISAAIALGKSIEGFKRGDTAAFIGNALVAAGSIIMIVTGATGIGAVVGLVLIAVGTAVTIFADSDLEAWVRGSFWGEGFYVYWDVRRDESFEKQLEDSKAIAVPNSEISAFHKQELEAFLDLIGGVKLENATPGDRKLEIACSALKSPADVSKLEVKLTQLVVVASPAGGGATSVPLQGVTHQLRYVGPGRAEIEFRNYTPPKRSFGLGMSTSDVVTATVSFPKHQGGKWTHKLSIKGEDL